MPNDVTLDVMHNKYFNYATEEDPVVYVRSRFYLFQGIGKEIPQFETVHFHVHETGEVDFSPAEMSLNLSNTLALNNAFKIIQKIQMYQTVNIVKLDLYHIFVERSEPNHIIPGINTPRNMAICDEVEKSLSNAIKLNENTGSFKLYNCHFPKSVLEHLAEQLHGCKRMKFLVLTGADYNFPIKLRESIATMESLEYANIYDFAQTPAICEAALKGLSVCSQLVNLNIGGNELTDCLRYLFPDSNHDGFPSLEELWIMDAKVSAGDLITIASTVKNGKLPQLKSFYLPQNILTSKIGALMGFQEGKYVYFPNLESCSFAKCMLNQVDVRSISQALVGNQFPKLQYLNLGFNTLTNCIKDLFGLEAQSSFSTLTALNLSCTQLSAADLRNLSRSFSQRVMQNCKTLDLSKNRLTGIVAELFAGHGLPFVKTLKLESVQLNAKDLENIGDAIASAKLPALSELLLTDSENCMTDDQVNKLLGVCIAFFADHRIHVRVAVVAVGHFLDYVEFEKRITERCKGTNVLLLCSLGRRIGPLGL